MRSQTVTAVAGVVVSVAMSVLAWWYLDTLLLFLFVPFVPLLFRSRWRPKHPGTGRDVQTCPRCDFQTGNSTYEYCPRDGTPLE